MASPPTTASSSTAHSVEPSTPPRPRPRNPIICIIGPTGTGKSALSVSLAKRFNGEIINADAMQMYRGLPIITNKIPPAEREGIPHHMLDFIGVEEEPWTVHRFVKEARQTIEQIRGRRKIPVVVGGTGYYVHGLVLGGLLDGHGESERKEKNGTDGEDKNEKDLEILDGSVEEMYEKLRELDPEMAQCWHPKDKRRIQRILEICLRSGRKASEVYKGQREGKVSGERQEGSGREEEVLLLWLDAEDAVLKDRLNVRVDSMVRDGLFGEATELAKVADDLRVRGVAVDKTKGIWVSIGYKELEPWINASATDGDGALQDSKLVFDCIDAVKAGTRQYAKRQNRYIRLRLAGALKEAGLLDRLYLLDSTDVSRWDETVVPQSEEVVFAFLEGRALPDPASLSEMASKTFAVLHADKESPLDRLARHCEACNKILVTASEWQRHLDSRSHKKVLQSQRRRALNGTTNAAVVIEIDGD